MSRTTRMRQWPLPRISWWWIAGGWCRSASRRSCSSAQARLSSDTSLARRRWTCSKPGWPAGMLWPSVMWNLRRRPISARPAPRISNSGYARNSSSWQPRRQRMPFRSISSGSTISATSSWCRRMPARTPSRWRWSVRWLCLATRHGWNSRRTVAASTPTRRWSDWLALPRAGGAPEIFSGHSQICEAVAGPIALAPRQPVG